MRGHTNCNGLTLLFIPLLCPNFRMGCFRKDPPPQRKLTIPSFLWTSYTNLRHPLGNSPPSERQKFPLWVIMFSFWNNPICKLVLNYASDSLQLAQSQSPSVLQLAIQFWLRPMLFKSCWKKLHNIKIDEHGIFNFLTNYLILQILTVFKHTNNF